MELATALVKVIAAARVLEQCDTAHKDTILSLNADEFSACLVKLLGKPKAVADQMTSDVFTAYSPDGVGLGVRELADYMISSHEYMFTTSTPKPLEVDKPVVTKAQQIQDLKKELKERDQELLLRDTRIGDFSTAIGKESNQLETDSGSLKQALPDSQKEREELIKKLIKKVDDRAKQLDGVIDREEKWLKKENAKVVKAKKKVAAKKKEAEKQAIAQARQVSQGGQVSQAAPAGLVVQADEVEGDGGKALMKDMSDDAAEIIKAVRRLLKETDDLKDKGELDVELEFQIKKLAAAGGKMARTLKEVSKKTRATD